MWSYDLIVASIVFITAMAILAYFWWSARTNMSEDKEAIIRESFKVSDALMSPGFPANWNTLVDPNDQSTWSNVQQIGLAESWANQSLSIDKVYKLAEMSFNNYSYTQSKVSPNYEFYLEFKFRNTSNNNLEQPVLLNDAAIVAGTVSTDLAKAIAKEDRIVVFDNSIVIMRLYHWSTSNID